MAQDLELPEQQKEERIWAAFCHLSAFAGLVFPPFGFVLGPVIIWIIKKEGMPLVADQGREAINFQLTMLIILIICFVLVFLLIGFLLIAFWGIFQFIIIIVATIKAHAGVYYRYPFAIRFIK